jgi:hypothetical protein
MDRDYVVKDQVRLFIQKILRFQRPSDGHLSFKLELEMELMIFYDAIDKLIFLYGVHKMLNEILAEHNLTCPLKANPESCYIHSFSTKALFFTEQEIGQLNPDFDFTFVRPNINSDLLKENLVRMKDYPEAARLYQKALNKLNEDQNERNILDDLRLSLEILLKNLLSNSKSLENQLNDIGSYVKNIGVSNEVRNMFTTLLDYYSKYQNNYVKHNDLVKRDEIDLIVNLTGAFISFLINK